MEYPETNMIEERERLMRWFLSACDTLSSMGTEPGEEPMLPEQKCMATTRGGVPPAEYARKMCVRGRMRRYTSATGM